VYQLRVRRKCVTRGSIAAPVVELLEIVLMCMHAIRNNKIILVEGNLLCCYYVAGSTIHVSH